MICWVLEFIREYFKVNFEYLNFLFFSYGFNLYIYIIYVFGCYGICVKLDSNMVNEMEIVYFVSIRYYIRIILYIVSISNVRIYLKYC